LDPSSVNPTDFTIVEKLGQGSFSDVLKIEYPDYHTFYAIKRLKAKFSSMEQVSNNTEIRTLKLLHGHPNIIQLYDVFYDAATKQVTLLMELLEMNLYEFSKDFGSGLTHIEHLHRRLERDSTIDLNIFFLI
jgi:renal tumor antigen